MQKIDFDKEIIVFVHIPKTGGSSIFSAARDLFGKENCFSFGVERSANLAAICAGH